MKPWTVLWLVMSCAAGGAAGVESVEVPAFFPAVTQFSPVPSGSGWKGEEGPVSEEILRATIDNILEHGFTGLELPTHRPPEEEAVLLEYARSKGMIISYHAGALEGFGRTEPPNPCVYTSEYAEAVRARVSAALESLKAVPNLYNVFTYQDEPFHWGPQSFGFGEAARVEFQKRYGYELPVDLNAISGNPQQWLDVINFQSAQFPDGWHQVYGMLKETNPAFKVTMTHDSHNTFGGGCTSHSELAIDDVFYWGGDFADLFVFDIYPYMMFDFRFGRPSQLPMPRISQTHYAFAQMRALTRAFKKDLGFWVGTYNPAWFGAFLCPELAAMHWSEREMSMTAVAQGANYLLTGYKIPVNAGHWESLGAGLRLLQKTGGRLLNMPKVQARACMLFPRTQYIQLQREYFNVGLSFELFLRAFGELDILHEDQVVDETLEGYELLVLFDLDLLPAAVMARIAGFVRNGGTVIADCVPRLNEAKEPAAVLEEVFGVSGMNANRIARYGHWVPYKTQPPAWANRPQNTPDETVFTVDKVNAAVLDVALDLQLVSPRPCTVTTAELLAQSADGVPVVLRGRAGKGQVFLLGFSLQDTYFQAYEDNNDAARAQLVGLLRAITESAGVQPHVRSSNPDIEVSVRANDREAILFVINHETVASDVTVELRELPFEIKSVLNFEDGRPVSFIGEEERIRLDLSVPLGEVRLLHLLPG
ncbi:MAG TPA: hypothetical protein PKO23_09120 [Candidatus Hydrogenedentes bacterium]|nr:hypothetical protein [Candidatus Hydrogenedentota bacterium]